MKKHRKIIAYLGILGLALGIMSFDSGPDIYAKTSSELRKEQEEAKKQLEKLENQKKELESARSGMQNELTVVSNDVSELKFKISSLETEIEIKEVELKEAEEKSSKQYEQMKLRIQFMYENSLNTDASYLFGASSISEFLNRAEYITSLTNYDRTLLNSYIETQNTIASAKKQLETDRATLLASQTDLEKKESQLLASIAGQKTQIESTTGNIGSQQDKLNSLDKEIQKMIAYENAMKEALGQNKPEISGLVKRSLVQREQSMPTWGRIVTPREGEEELLAALIYCEAGGEPYEGMLAVGTVVLNRVNSQFFKNTITDVIYSPGQFQPVWSGRLAVVMSKGLTTDKCRKAAREVLNGKFTGTWLYFCTTRPTVTGDIIGNQVFY